MAWNINTDLVKGDNLLLYLTSGKTVVAYATSVSLEVNAESIDVSSKFGCKWSQSLGGKLNYTISADALYCSGDGMSFDDLVELMLKGEAVEWYIGEEASYTGTCEDNPHTLDTGATYYNGTAVITSCSLSAGNNEIASCSISMTGASEIKKSDTSMMTS